MLESVRVEAGETERVMKMTVVADTCKAPKRCPTVYATDRGSIVVQGYIVRDAENVEVPSGEALVEIPIDLLREAARATNVVGGPVNANR